MHHQLSVVCANLKRRKDRRFVMSRTLPTVCGVPVIFLEAIDGESIPQWKVSRRHPKASQSEYAVRLTKRIALRNFLQSDQEFLLYLEDDVVVSKNFGSTVVEAMERGEDLIYLGGGHHRIPWESGRWRRVIRTYNNHALLFSRAGARKALSILGKWRQPSSDKEIQRATVGQALEAWCIQPWVAFQRETSSDNWGNTDCVSLAGTTKPWMLPDDLAVLDAALINATRVLEYGSGGSTYFIASRLGPKAQFVSIEHKRTWHEKTSKELRASGLSATCVLQEPKPNREKDGPWRYLPGQLDDYVKEPLHHFEPGSLDLAFIDGRERIRCIQIAATLLKPGGLLLVHDFWNRKRYRAYLDEILKDFDYLFESPNQDGRDPQGLAVFQCR